MSATPNTPDDTRPVVLITGCSSGIGRALAVEFAGAGKHRVVATARKMSALETLPPNVYRFALDVTDAESVREAVEEAVRQLGRIDLLINNAGTNAAVGPVVEVDIERQRQTFEANYFGLLRVTQAVAPHMIKQRSGTIVNVGSTAALCPLPYAGAYAASKAAVHAVSDCMRAELAGFGINVVILAPGAIKSSIGDAGEGTIQLAKSSSYENVADMIKYRAQYSQLGHPTPTAEFAAVVRKAVVKRRPRAYLVTGAKSTMAFIMYYMPGRFRDFFLSRIFQLWRVGRST